jgi:hypothetical protein
MRESIDILKFVMNDVQTSPEKFFSIANFLQQSYTAVSGCSCGAKIVPWGIRVGVLLFSHCLPPFFHED